MADRPTGTVTFLFTDVEGSTRLWEQDATAMSTALGAHDRIVRTAIESRGGYIFSTAGDSFAAAFSSVRAAAESALEAQRSLATLVEPLDLRVRMGIHTGSAEERSGDYFGPAVNRSARLMAAGHGGQILLSETAGALLDHAVPARAELVDLGRHRLKDLARADRIFGLRPLESTETFPPLRTLDPIPNNLPVQATSFIGREAEVADVMDKIRAGRLVTITGVGGGGKTRLGLQVAANLSDRYADGVWLADLTTAIEPGLATATVLAAVGGKPQRGLSTIDSLIDAVRGTDTLIFLDNCEHVIEEAAEVAAALIRSTVSVQVMATSRERLNIAGEHVFQLPQLAVPIDRAHDRADVLSTASVKLFVERARDVRGDFEVTEENIDDVAAICRRLEGIPLAIELAAARLGILRPDQIAERLADRFRLLRGHRRHSARHHATLEATVAWSYDLLDDDAKALFRRLGVFAGSFSLEAAEALLPDLAADGLLVDRLAKLADRSLILSATNREAGRSGVRFMMLETLRDYAEMNAKREGEWEKLAADHARHFAALAADLDRLFRGDSDPGDLLATEADHGNLRKALRWAIDGGDEQLAMSMATDLERFWWVRGHLGEGRMWLDRVMTAFPDPPDQVQQGRVLLGAAWLAGKQGDLSVALDVALTARQRLADAADAATLAKMHNVIGVIHSDVGAPAEAAASFQRAADAAVSAGLSPLAANINLGIALTSTGRWGEAIDLLAPMPSTDEDGGLGSIAGALMVRGLALFANGELDDAESELRQALELVERIEHLDFIAGANVWLAWVLLRSSRFDEARIAAERAMAVGTQIGTLGDQLGASFVLAAVDLAESSPVDVTELFRHMRGSPPRARWMLPALLVTADILADRGDEARAASVVGTAEAILSAAGYVLPVPEAGVHRSRTARLRETLGEEAYSLATARGRDWDVPDALDRAEASLSVSTPVVG